MKAMRIAGQMITADQVEAGRAALCDVGTFDAVHAALIEAGVSPERISPLTASYAYRATRNIIAYERRKGHVTWNGERWIDAALADRG